MSSDHAHYSYLLLHGRASSRHWSWQPISEVARCFGKQDTYIHKDTELHFEYMLEEYIWFIYHMCTKFAGRIFCSCPVGEDFCNFTFLKPYFATRYYKLCVLPLWLHHRMRLIT